MVCWLCATILKLSPKPSDPSKDEISGKYTALGLFSAHTHIYIHIYITVYVCLLSTIFFCSAILFPLEKF